MNVFYFNNCIRELIIMFNTIMLSSIIIFSNYYIINLDVNELFLIISTLLLDFFIVILYFLFTYLYNKYLPLKFIPLLIKDDKFNESGQHYQKYILREFYIFISTFVTTFITEILILTKKLEIILISFMIIITFFFLISLCLSNKPYLTRLLLCIFNEN